MPPLFRLMSPARVVAVPSTSPGGQPGYVVVLDGEQVTGTYPERAQAEEAVERYERWGCIRCGLPGPRHDPINPDHSPHCACDYCY